MAQLEGRILPQPPIAHTAVDLALRMADEPAANDLPNSLHEALKTSHAYKVWKTTMPSLAQVPALHRYRNEHPHYDASALYSEIVAHGKPLPPGQLLFHGGVWPCPEPIGVGQVLTTDRVLSTSLCPQVAALHATYHAGGALWLIQISPSGASKPAFVFNSDRRQRLNHEHEVVIAPGATLTCTSVCRRNRMLAIEVQLT